MQITTTTTITISDENASLIPFIIAKNGGKIGEETDEEAIIRLRNDVSFMNAYGQIAPHVQSFFGEANKESADAILNALNNEAITVNTTIDED